MKTKQKYDSSSAYSTYSYKKANIKKCGEISMYITLDGEYCYSKEMPKEGNWFYVHTMKQYRNV